MQMAQIEKAKRLPKYKAEVLPKPRGEYRLRNNALEGCHFHQYHILPIIQYSTPYDGIMFTIL